MTQQQQFEDISKKVTIYLSEATKALRQSRNHYLKVNPQIVEALETWDWMAAYRRMEERIIDTYKAFRPDEAIGTFAICWDEVSNRGFSIYFSDDNSYSEWLGEYKEDTWIDLSDIIDQLFPDKQNWAEDLRLDLEIYTRLFLGMVELAAISVTQHEVFLALPKMNPYLILSTLWHDTEFCVIYSSNQEHETWLQIEEFPEPPPVLLEVVSEKELILFGETYNVATKWIRASDMGIGEIPVEIGLLKATEDVDLRKNLLSKLPESFFTLSHIKNLNLSSNRFSILSPEIIKLEHLHQLDLANNLLETLPETISGLVQLKALHLQNNKIKHLPALNALPQLKELNAYNNELSALPELPTGLEFLIVHGNKLSELPGHFAEMRNLKTLVLSDNAFAKVPKVILKMESLESLELGGNYLEDIPLALKQLPKLRELRVYPNAFTKEKRKALRKSFGSMLFLGYDSDENSFMK